MNVPCNASLSRTRTPGNAALRIACHATPRSTIDTHITPSPASTHAGWEATSERTMLSTPMRSSATKARKRMPSATAPRATLRAIASAGCGEPAGGGGSRLGSRRGRTYGRPSADFSPCARRRARERGHRDRVLVGAEDVLRDPRPRVALRGVRGAPAEALAALGVQREVAQRRGQRRRVAARDEDAVAAVGHDVGVAGDVRRHDRRARGERLRQHHAERLAAERRRDQEVGLAQRLALALVGDLAQRVDAAVVEQHAVDLVGRRADDLELDGQVLAQRLEGAQQHRQPLALDRLADEDELQRLTRERAAASPRGDPASTCTPLGITR